MPINISTIKQRLFSDSVVRDRILRDYGITRQPMDADELGNAVVGALGQQPSPAPLEQVLSNAEVFRAAVKSIGSNSRSWATFLKLEPTLRQLLHDYDPLKTSVALEHGELTLDQLKACLPGQSSSGDALAIRRWATLLSGVDNYYGFIQNLGHTFRGLHQARFDKPLDDVHLLLCLVGYLANPPSTWTGSMFAPHQPQLLTPRQRKLPGISYALASEFFRNLGWNGFKPDRHIQRLFDRWFPDRSMVRADVQRLQSLIGRRDQQLTTYLTYSLVGIAASPSDVPLSQVDNFVWLLGAYVEKKGHESETSYVM